MINLLSRHLLITCSLLRKIITYSKHCISVPELAILFLVLVAPSLCFGSCFIGSGIRKRSLRWCSLWVSEVGLELRSEDSRVSALIFLFAPTGYVQGKESKTRLPPCFLHSSGEELLTNRNSPHNPMLLKKDKTLTLSSLEPFAIHKVSQREPMSNNSCVHVSMSMRQGRTFATAWPSASTDICLDLTVRFFLTWPSFWMLSLRASTVTQQFPWSMGVYYCTGIQET